MPVESAVIDRLFGEQVAGKGKWQNILIPNPGSIELRLVYTFLFAGLVARRLYLG